MDIFHSQNKLSDATRLTDVLSNVFSARCVVLWLRSSSRLMCTVSNVSHSHSALCFYIRTQYTLAKRVLGGEKDTRNILYRKCSIDKPRQQHTRSQQRRYKNQLLVLLFFFRCLFSQNSCGGGIIKTLVGQVGWWVV